MWLNRYGLINFITLFWSLPISISGMVSPKITKLLPVIDFTMGYLCVTDEIMVTLKVKVPLCKIPQQILLLKNFIFKNSHSLTAISLHNGQPT